MQQTKKKTFFHCSSERIWYCGWMLKEFQSKKNNINCAQNTKNYCAKSAFKRIVTVKIGRKQTWRKWIFRWSVNYCLQFSLKKALILFFNASHSQFPSSMLKLTKVVPIISLFWKFIASCAAHFTNYSNILQSNADSELMKKIE